MTRPGMRGAGLAAAWLASVLIGAGPAAALDANWIPTPTVAGPTPGSFDFDAGANWSGATVPTGTASFATSTGTQISFSASAFIGTMQFNIGAPAYSFDLAHHDLTFNGTGILNNSANAPTITVPNSSFGPVQPGSTLTFLNSSSAGNAQIVNNSLGGASGTGLSFQNNSTAGSATITNNGVANFSDASTAATATIINSGSLNFQGTSSAANASITLTGWYGVLGFADSSTAGNATITVLNNGNELEGVGIGDHATAGNATILNYNAGLGGNGVTFGGDGSAGNAHITNFVGGQTIFYDQSTAANATIINDGGSTVFFGPTATAGNATFLNTNGGRMQFNFSTTAGYSTITTDNGSAVIFAGNSTAGAARLVTNAGGSVDFSLTSGPLSDNKVSAGSIEGAGTYYLGADQLTVGSNNLSTTVSGVISDCGAGADCNAPGATGGSLVKVGTGTLTLAGNNTYTGATTVDAGALNVTGSTATSSLLSVNTGAVLEGTGIVGNTNINSGGTLAPGNGTAGTSLAISGSLAFQSGAMYLVQVNPATSSFTNVTGTATLGGATVDAMFANGSYISKQYTILTANGGVSGTFDPTVANTNLPANFHTTLSYDADHAYLNLILGFAIPGGLNVNQTNVANALTGFFNRTGGIPMVFGALTPAGLTQASGELPTAAQQTTFDAMNLFLGLLTDPFVAGRGAPAASSTGVSAANGKSGSKSERDAYAPLYRKAPLAQTYDPRWSVWTAGFGGSQTTDGNAVLGSNAATSRVFGMAVGADYLLSPRTIAGFALAGGGTNFSVANGLGTGRSDLFQAGAFARHTAGQAYVSGALAYGWQDVTTDRTVALAGIDQLRARFNVNAYSGRVEGGYRFVVPWISGVGITPYAAGQFTTFDLPAYAEQVLSGTNTFALAYGLKSVTDTRSEMGIRADKSFVMQNAILTLRGRAAWAHDYSPERNIGATFQTLPGASFVVNGAEQASDSALTTASVEMKWLNGWSAAGTFEGEFSNVSTSYAAKGVVRYQW